MEPPKLQINLNILPPETITEILLVLKLPDLLNFCKTSHTAMEYCESDQFWKAKYKRDFPNLPLTISLSWKEKYKLIYGVPNSPISAGVASFSVIDDQNMLYTSIKNEDHHSDGEILSKTPIFNQKMRSVSTGYYFTGAVTNDGKVYLWGRGLGVFFGDQYLGGSKPREFPIPGRAIKITCGPKMDRVDRGDRDDFPPMFAVILEDRSVFLRMAFLFYNLSIRKIISTIINIKAVDISVNGYGIAIVSTDGKLYYMGNSFGLMKRADIGITYKNDDQFVMGQAYIFVPESIKQVLLAHDQFVINPVHIPLPESVKQVSLAHDHIGVLSTKGNMYLWGSNFHGQLGQGRTSGPKDYGEFFVDLPQKLTFPVPISFITCQEETTAVIDKNGKLYIWGKNTSIIDPSEYANHLENIIVHQEALSVPQEYVIYEKGMVIPAPILIAVKHVLSGNNITTKNIFNYVAIGEFVTIATTSDGFVNIITT